MNEKSNSQRYLIVFLLLLIVILLVIGLTLGIVYLSRTGSEKESTPNQNTPDITQDNEMYDLDEDDISMNLENNESELTTIFSFKDGVDVELVEKSIEVSEFGSHTIVEVDYESEEEFFDNVYGTSDWGTSLFYLPITDSYYVLYPGGHKKVSVVSKAMVANELEGFFTDTIEETVRTKDCIRLPWDTVNGVSLEILDCVITTTYGYDEYQDITERSSCLFEVSETEYIMFEVPLAPASTDINTCETLAESLGSMRVI
ncbi:hypothetical protein KC717_04425 [Candidatus Dojkabacteria bacterium]|uniref:Uncharacterized protein n=1 Tax=Candidatus Dojkabacteria bacterium TaxID=2099670 RepID=A0A955L8W6_9BACT|nr:hypothetical protein [Candidatus Dojkabacteria bacterium]